MQARAEDLPRESVPRRDYPTPPDQIKHETLRCRCDKRTWWQARDETHRQIEFYRLELNLTVELSGCWFRLAGHSDCPRQKRRRESCDGDILANFNRAPHGSKGYESQKLWPSITPLAQPLTRPSLTWATIRTVCAFQSDAPASTIVRIETACISWQVMSQASSVARSQ